MKDEIKEIYNENGVAVRVDSYVKLIKGPRSVEVVIEVHKLYEIGGTRPLLLGQ